ncbi:hypothetical protein G6F16_014179 [Rhizopus arrhizus]|nr:hypothetical protein G6F18_014219 [Rhizopus arrhizus]KAG0848159.1 hypothetical protein G6F16_014179 [Rhizopus arrhizus]
MTDNNQSIQVSSLNEKGKTGKQEETSRVSEDTEMANVEETPSLMAASLVSNDDKSVDAVMGLWYLAPHKNSSQNYKNKQSA